MVVIARSPRPSFPVLEERSDGDFVGREALIGEL
jgi:hypothetical protein